jgi:uncharacterized protein YfaS (alpha-2-macroglobulin family)
MNSYQPGDTVRLSSSITILGALQNPSGIEVQVQPPGGVVVVYSSPTNDSAGNYHQDFVVPTNPVAPSGLWKYRWTASGSAAGVGEGAFLVRPLSF